MNNAFATVILVMSIVGFNSCKTVADGQSISKIKYDYLYDKVWVVDSVILLGKDVSSTPNIETDKNEYQFVKEGGNPKQGTRTTVTPEASFEVSYVIKKGIINFDQAMTFPQLNFDEDGNLISSNMFVSLPPYQIIELSNDKLVLENSDIRLKLRVK